MAAYSEAELNTMFKHIMLMNGPELTKELEALEKMSPTLKTLLHPVVSDIDGLESKIETIIRIYVSHKFGSIDEDAMDSILEHSSAILSIITANGAIGGSILGYLNADKKIIQDKSTVSIETVATLYGNKEVEKTEDSEEVSVSTSAKASLNDNTKKFLELINNGVKD